jgi:hypothetical protein
MSQTRRLAAILAADVAGYSRLMGADEEGTLERLKARTNERPGSVAPSGQSRNSASRSVALGTGRMRL